MKSLPRAYTKLNYIESSGTQYIDTNRISTPNTKIELDYLSLKTDGGTYQNVFGSQESGGKKRIYIGIGSTELINTNFPQTNTHQVVYPKTDGTFATSTSESNIVYVKYNNRNKIIYDLPNKSVTIGQYTAVNTNTLELCNSNHNILIFNRNDATIPTTGLAIGRLYSFKWYENNTLIMDLIPCKRNSDNEIGLYDLVNDVFYTNSGTGTFITG